MALPRRLRRRAALGLGLAGALRHGELIGDALRVEEVMGNLWLYLTAAGCEQVAGDELFSGGGAGSTTAKGLRGSPEGMGGCVGFAAA